VQDEEDEEALAEKFAEAFNQIDIDSEGSIVAEQLGSVLECLGMVRVINVSLGSR
jgi:Ca2+-binding EF-hand superfamily protein